MNYTKEQIDFFEDLRARWICMSLNERTKYVFDVQEYLWYILPEEEKQKVIKEREEEMESDKDNPFVLKRIKPYEPQQT